MVFINHDARNTGCRSDQHLYFVRFNHRIDRFLLVGFNQGGYKKDGEDT